VVTPSTSSFNNRYTDHRDLQLATAEMENEFHVGTPEFRTENVSLG